MKPTGAVNIAKNLHNAWELATKHLENAQEQMRRKTNIRRRPIDFNVGDFVWLDMRYFPSQRPSKKLDFPTNGKFKIIEKVGNSFRLQKIQGRRLKKLRTGSAECSEIASQAQKKDSVYFERRSGSLSTPKNTVRKKFPLSMAWS
ncbi:hypothetical protein EPUL_004193 [Erysiphe pulchra]|uniref:Integrase zinc-binding domain-containing protein n=1 Tax=Erysiphe pulchra TaxID=225359 RepID=A0A2S4PQ80_9PEZI|nr:hypothetical protein EPUL_004193 [Erysiphe pulchra]